MNRYVCIHGHFYQPPRENPWLEMVELQDSAYPYHDWNERITAECYAPNSVARILDADGRIARLVNNYSRISFNFGPTLLAWIEHNAPDVYQRVLDADRESRDQFHGHGSALAQVYNHIIMPLANHAGQGDPGGVGHSRLPASVRARARGDVAGGDGRRSAHARSAWRSTGSGSRCWPPTRRRGFVGLGRRNGRT